VIVGPDEVAAGQVSVRDLATRDQVTMPADDLVGWLKEHASAAAGTPAP
jgi:histidyl-tRNA synthetase